MDRLEFSFLAAEPSLMLETSWLDFESTQTTATSARIVRRLLQPVILTSALRALSLGSICRRRGSGSAEQPAARAILTTVSRILLCRLIMPAFSYWHEPRCASVRRGCV